MVQSRKKIMKQRQEIKQSWAGRRNFPANLLVQSNNTNARKMCEICSKLTIKTPQRRHLRRSGACIVNLEHISQRFLVFLWLALNKWVLAGFGMDFCVIFDN